MFKVICHTAFRSFFFFKMTGNKIMIKFPFRSCYNLRVFFLLFFLPENYMYSFCKGENSIYSMHVKCYDLAALDYSIVYKFTSLKGRKNRRVANSCFRATNISSARVQSFSIQTIKYSTQLLLNGGSGLDLDYFVILGLAFY